MRYVLALVVVASVGCARVASVSDVSGVAGYVPPSASVLGGPLASADMLEPEIIELPGLSSWPVTMMVKGPIYALAQLNPVVAQLGVLADADRADPGVGIGVVIGYRILSGGTSTLGLEYILQRSTHHNPSSAVDGTALRTGGAVRFTFGGDAQLQPFIVGGGGIYSLVYDGLADDFNLVGVGLMMGGGVDYAFSRNLSMRGDMELHLWDAAEKGSGNGGMAATLSLGIGAALSF